MSASVLDQLVFQAIPLGEVLPKWPPALDVRIATASTSGTVAPTKVYTQATPLFARRSAISSSDVNWAAYCGLLRDSGVLMQASFAEMEALSDVNVPQRMVRRKFDEGFDLSDLISADAVLIDCVATLVGQKCSRLPLEISGWHELKSMIESMRQVIGPGVPIGLNMLAGDIYTDVSNALAARVDFVVLEFDDALLSNAALDHVAWCVVAARNACVQSGIPHFPLLIDAPLTNIAPMIKLLALGASMLSVDAWLAGAMPAPAASSVQVPKGLLSGIGSLPVKATPNIQPVTNRLNELLDAIRARLYQQHLSSLGQFSAEHLRGLTDQAARICAVKLLLH